MNPDTGGVVFSTNLKNRQEAIVGTYVYWYGRHLVKTLKQIHLKSSIIKTMILHLK